LQVKESHSDPKHTVLRQCRSWVAKLVCESKQSSMIERALLVVDIQNDFTGQRAKLPIDKLQTNEIIANINKLIEYAQQLRFVVVYIGNEFALYNPLNIFRNFAAIKGSQGAKLDPKLVVVNNNYFPKQTGDAFSNPDLIDFLKRNKIREILLTGVKAEACTLHTTKGALRNSLAVKVVADAVGTKSQKKWQACLDRYSQIGAEIVVADQLINNL
jgi:nicotinamidase-related amidase